MQRKNQVAGSVRHETFVIQNLEQVNHLKVVVYRASGYFLRKGRGVCVRPCLNRHCHKLPRQPQLNDGERPQLIAALSSPPLAAALHGSLRNLTALLSSIHPQYRLKHPHKHPMYPRGGS